MLIVVFSGDTSRLIPLYAVGVFLSFTLSQAGMVRHWLSRAGKEPETLKMPDRIKAIHAAIADLQLALGPHGRISISPSMTRSRGSKNWRRSLAINLVGAIATAVVLTVFVVTKFMHGAWLVVLIIPALVVMFKAIHRHYVSVSRAARDHRHR